MMRKTKKKVSYRSWESDFTWIQKDKDSSNAYCKVCNSSFRIDNSGLSQLKAHASADSHKKKVQLLAGKTSQRVIVSTSRNNLSLSSTTSVLLTPEDEVVKAETLQALDYVSSNYSFVSAKNDSEKFRRMFPDSKIAEAYQQGETKIKYVIQFGIAPYIKNELLNDFKNQPFTFKFGETTTSQVKKQYDGYVQFWSNTTNQIVNRYCGSVFVGQCRSEQLEHFDEFAEELNWDPAFLLHIGMDVPNVNLKFQNDLMNHFQETSGESFLDIDTCTLHKVHTSFKKGVQKLPVDIDQFAVDLHGFFKLSSARWEDYTKLQDVTEVTSQYILRHSSVRWLTLKFVLVRIIEQWSNLKDYFCNFIPKQKEFKSSIRETKRYKNIRTCLDDEMTLPYLSFVVFLAHEYVSFLLTFQTGKPLIHMLYHGTSTLLSNLLQHFVSKKSMYISVGGN